jgi:hypothetical protein
MMMTEDDDHTFIPQHPLYHDPLLHHHHAAVAAVDAVADEAKYNNLPDNNDHHNSKAMRPSPPTYAFDWYTIEAPTTGWHWKIDIEDNELVLKCDSRGFVPISASAYHRCIDYIRWDRQTLPQLIPHLALMDLVDCFNFFLAESGNEKFPLEYRGKIADLVADLTVLIADPVNDFKVEEKQVWEEVLFTGAMALVAAICPFDDLSAATQNVRFAIRFVDVIDSSGFCGAGVVKSCRDYLNHIPPSPAPLDRC